MLNLVHFSLRSESIMFILKDVPGNFFWRGSIFLLPHISNVFISHNNNFIVLKRSTIYNGLYKQL
jgi:hypothetical protein